LNGNLSENKHENFLKKISDKNLPVYKSIDNVIEPTKFKSNDEYDKFNTKNFNSFKTQKSSIALFDNKKYKEYPYIFKSNSTSKLKIKIDKIKPFLIQK
jgi:hypothetical protein